ncbi:hypothetical protein GQ53DRAFT_825896 [Thozetella sp. PMI_491]|nr:hypothetical protein GQ53DRAFT_825896 [Thozetella sp. PMI_491]
MSCRLAFTFFLLFYLLPISGAVQLFSNASFLPSSASADCASALMANITCAQLISPLYISNGGFLDVGTLNSLCTSSCSSSLATFQSSTESRCGTSVYSFPGDYNQTIPAIVEPVIWAHAVACLQSSSTYCVPIITNASSGISPCSDCFLKYEAAMLDSLYGQVHITPTDFSSLLSSCSVPATSYPYTTPQTPTASSSSSSGSSVSAAPTCTGNPYTVQGGDTCQSIALANSIATDRFITDNHLDYNCTTIAAGRHVCLPQSCLLYQVQASDTCDSILANEDFYLTQLLSWNPTFVFPPTSFTAVSNQTVALNYTTSYLNPTTSINISTSTASIDTAAIESYVSLMAYCPITSNDTLAGWTIPDLPDNCTSALSLYCSPTANATMLPSTTFPTTCSPAYWDGLLSTTAPSTTTNGGPPGPTQTGIAPNCDAWYVVVAGDTCDGIVSKYGNLTLAQFYSWNPAVGSSCQFLDSGYAVCIGVSGSSSATSSSSAGTTTSAPSPTLPDTDPECTSYYYVKSGDSCFNIEQEYDISADQFNVWNPFVGTDCTNLWASEYICVGAPYTSVMTTTSVTPTITSSSTSSAPSPLEPSTDPQCTKWHYVVSGDTCFDIEQEYGITATQVSNLTLCMVLV